MSRRSKPARSLRHVLGYENERVVRDFALRHSLDRTEVASLFRELLKLLWLSSARERPGSYPIVLHALWREVVVDTAEYERFCRRYLGRFVHHDPAAAVDPSQARSDADLDAAIALVYQALGQDTASHWFGTLVERHPPSSLGGATWAEYADATQGRPPTREVLRALRRFERRPIARRRFAIDLGCGSGRDTTELLRRGWRVLAIDADPHALATLVEAAPTEGREQLTLRCARFERLERLPRCDLVNARLSLPFCTPTDFPRVWSLVAGALRPGGRFTGWLLGEDDGWASNPAMTIHSIAGLRELLAGFRIERLRERRWKGTSLAGEAKRWHVLAVVARRRAEPNPA